MRFENRNIEKKISVTTSAHSIFFSYMEHSLKHLLKPPHPINEVVAKVFLKKFPNFVILKIFARRCSPCSVASEKCGHIRGIWGTDQ